VTRLSVALSISMLALCGAKRPHSLNSTRLSRVERHRARRWGGERFV
jgi:hypothetical protein